jgi:hypothetical protein
MTRNDELLALIRWHCSEAKRCRWTGPGEQHAYDVVELFEELDGWLTDGFPKPEDWK